MRVHARHRWDVPLDEAKRLQNELRRQVDVTPRLMAWDVVAGADVSYNRFSNTIFAAVVVWRASTGTVLETRSAVRETAFRYQPGYLSFREAPAVLAALELVEPAVDVVLLDGQGIAHPRRTGLATHVGLWIDVPTVGVAKSLLTGKCDEPGPLPGDRSPLHLDDEIVGVAIRTKRRSAPLVVSPGHRIDLASALAVVEGCLRGYRLPEPTRLAHLAVNEARRGGVR